MLWFHVFLHFLLVPELGCPHVVISRFPTFPIDARARLPTCCDFTFSYISYWCQSSVAHMLWFHVFLHLLLMPELGCPCVVISRFSTFPLVPELGCPCVVISRFFAFPIGARARQPMCCDFTFFCISYWCQSSAAHVLWFHVFLHFLLVPELGCPCVVISRFSTFPIGARFHVFLDFLLVPELGCPCVVISRFPLFPIGARARQPMCCDFTFSYISYWCQSSAAHVLWFHVFLHFLLVPELGSPCVVISRFSAFPTGARARQPMCCDFTFFYISYWCRSSAAHVLWFHVFLHFLLVPELGCPHVVISRFSTFSIGAGARLRSLQVRQRIRRQIQGSWVRSPARCLFITLPGFFQMILSD